MNNNYIIRLEKPADYSVTENLTREAFWNVYRPGCLEHYVLHCFRDKEDFVPELDFVMEINGEIIGHIMYVRSEIHADDGRTIPIMTFGPISIAPAYQRRGYGKRLLDHALERAAAMGAGCICMEGNIGFYGHCGFVVAGTRGLRYHGAPEGEEVPFFLCRELQAGFLDGVTGVYGPPAGYFVDENEADAFDAAFPPKEKRKLPGQLF